MSPLIRPPHNIRIIDEMKSNLVLDGNADRRHVSAHRPAINADSRHASAHRHAKTLIGDTHPPIDMPKTLIGDTKMPIVSKTYGKANIKIKKKQNQHFMLVLFYVHSVKNAQKGLQ